MQKILRVRVSRGVEYMSRIFRGDAGANRFFGTELDELFFGRGGKDKIRGGDGDDTIHGGEERDGL
ncbi:MAG: hypothetical protein AAFU55_03740, partial [Pseudomonadota bacterium]